MFQFYPPPLFLIFAPAFLLGILHTLIPCEDKAIFFFWSFGISKTPKKSFFILLVYGLGLMSSNLIIAVGLLILCSGSYTKHNNVLQCPCVSYRAISMSNCSVTFFSSKPFRVEHQRCSATKPRVGATKERLPWDHSHHHHATLKGLRQNNTTKQYTDLL